MDFQDKRYVIGIDLGTTNSAVSYADVDLLKERIFSGREIEKKNLIKVFNVPQLTGHGEFTKVPVLPSFLYIPGDYDISKEVLKHPWKKQDDRFAGVFARDHGSKIPSRLVSSAKSWLCNANADRESKILPWGSQNINKVSPVTATAEYLRHIRSAWNSFVKDEDLFLENQFVVITVPASFNEEARDLTLKAAQEAGFKSKVTLLEEPLAAFYSWLIDHEKDWQDHVSTEDLILVCDVGGGTTDFSLITLKDAQGTPRFERLAVGDHLILGGDNIDLALAKIVESKFKSKSELTADKWKTLCHRCREAKERILEKEEVSVRITLKGEGKSLIAGTLSADLTREEVESALTNEFFSDKKTDKISQREPGKMIADFGLPFEKEASVTKHIGWFLEKHREDVKRHLGKDPIPDHILFNGGSLIPQLVQERIRSAIRNWFGKKDESLPSVLENKTPLLSVGVGASYYGLVKQGEGVKVGSGSPRSYYLGIANAENQDKSQAVCVVERGLDEGSPIELSDMEFEVLTNQPVSFDIYSSSFRSGDVSGDVISVDESVSEMSPIQTVIKFGKKGDKKTIPVILEAEYTEMGTLAMHCMSGVSDHKWRLQFQLRDHQENIETLETEIFDEDITGQACDQIINSFVENPTKEFPLKSVVKKIEAISEKRKVKWPLSFLRRLADTLLDISDKRNFSAEYEARWLNLAGFCMRPGFGDAFDEERSRKFWKIYLNGIQFPKSPQNRLEWWIFIRRIAGGMKAGQQRQFFQDVSSILLKSKNAKVKLSPQEQIELWMAAGNMERLLVKDKVALSKALLPQIASGKNPENKFWVLSRLGARELLYGSQDRVVPPIEVSKWIRQIMKKEWNKKMPVDNMVAQMSRKTGDRTIDINQDALSDISKWLKIRGADQSLIKIIHEKMDIAVKEKSIQFGESLPTGLVLKKTS